MAAHRSPKQTVFLDDAQNFDAVGLFMCLVYLPVVDSVNFHSMPYALHVQVYVTLEGVDC